MIRVYQVSHCDMECFLCILYNDGVFLGKVQSELKPATKLIFSRPCLFANMTLCFYRFTPVPTTG